MAYWLCSRYGRASLIAGDEGAALAALKEAVASAEAKGGRVFEATAVDDRGKRYSVHYHVGGFDKFCITDSDEVAEDALGGCYWRSTSARNIVAKVPPEWAVSATT